MTIEEVPLGRFDALVDDGSIIDATTILGVRPGRAGAWRTAGGQPGLTGRR